MGALTSRQNVGVEEIDVSANHAYKYPPRSGNYFGSHFIMGGERFDTPQPESYLFGENTDLNFLGSRPTSFPYPPPQAHEPTKTLKSLVNIRKESLRFIRAPPHYSKLHLDQPDGDNPDRDLETVKSSLYNIEFTFDCDVRCAITIFYFCTEEITANGVTYVPRDPSLNSETFHYYRGANQQFCHMSHLFDPSKFSEEELIYNVEKDIIPIAINCVAEEGSDEVRQSHTTIAIIEKHSDGSYVLKALKQKLFVDGLCYLLQEIYGIENKNHDTKATGDDDNEDNGSECVICMCDVRDTLILPCRHLCLCNSCADSLRYQANNCPICRAPFRALLQIRALQKTGNSIQQPPSPPDGTPEIPAGYEAVSLIEALNGPCLPRQPPSAVPDIVETPDTENAVQAAEILNRSIERTPSKGNSKDADVKRERNSNSCNTPEFRMSVLISRDDDNKVTQKSPLLEGDPSGYRSSKGSRPRDSVRHINEKDSPNKDETQDEDSEAEKLSPLLHTTEKNCQDSAMPLDMEGVVEPIDYSDTEHDEQLTKTSPKPKPKLMSRAAHIDPSAAERSPPLVVSSLESTPQRHCLQSLPGTPLSHVSTRSSGDSYSSSSSTRHLLAVTQGNNAANDRTVQI